jgi:hypothetical protein
MGRRLLAATIDASLWSAPTRVGSKMPGLQCSGTARGTVQGLCLERPAAPAGNVIARRCSLDHMEVVTRYGLGVSPCAHEQVDAMPAVERDVGSGNSDRLHSGNSGRSTARPCTPRSSTSRSGPWPAGGDDRAIGFRESVPARRSGEDGEACQKPAHVAIGSGWVGCWRGAPGARFQPPGGMPSSTSCRVTVKTCEIATSR